MYSWYPLRCPKTYYTLSHYTYPRQNFIFLAKVNVLQVFRWLYYMINIVIFLFASTFACIDIYYMAMRRCVQGARGENIGDNDSAFFVNIIKVLYDTHTSVDWSFASKSIWYMHVLFFSVCRFSWFVVRVWFVYTYASDSCTNAKKLAHLLSPPPKADPHPHGIKFHSNVFFLNYISNYV